MARLPCLLVVALLLFGPSTAQAANINSFAGAYLVGVKRIYQCGEGCQQALHWKIRSSHFSPARPRELQRLTGYMHLANSTYDDTVTGKVIIDKRNNNQWKENFFVSREFPNACSVLRKHAPDVFRVLFFGLPANGQRCSVPPGNYTFTSEPVAWVYPYFPVMPYGEFRLRFAVGQPGLRLLCMCFDAVVTPKI